MGLKSPAAAAGPAGNTTAAAAEPAESTTAAAAAPVGSTTAGHCWRQRLESTAGCCWWWQERTADTVHCLSIFTGTLKQLDSQRHATASWHHIFVT